MKDLPPSAPLSAPSGKARALIHATSAAAILLGGSVIYAWCVHSPFILRIHAGFAPMQFSAALSFFLVGLSLLMAPYPRYRTASILCSGAVFLVSIVTGAQYILGIDFGIDDLFHAPFDDAPLARVARMAPNTALSFGLLTGALLLWHFLKNRESAVNLAVMAGIVAFLIGLTALIGYIAHIQGSYDWEGLNRFMAFHTAIGLIFLSVGLFALVALDASHTKNISLQVWMPWLVMASGIIISTLIAQGMALNNKKYAAALKDAAIAPLTLNDIDSAQDNLVFLVFLAGVGLSFSLAYTLRQIDGRRRSDVSASGFRSRLESILDNVVDGLITIDEKGTVLSYNKACEKIFGYKAREVVGQNVNMLMPRSYASQHDQYLKNYMQGGPRKIIGIGREVEGRRKDGTIFPIDLSVAEVKLAGKERIFSGIVRDITLRRNHENELKRSNEELERFAYIASHDLKAPLRNIDDLAKWTLEDTKGILPEEPRRNLQLLCNRVNALETLLDDILAYSRAGRIVGDAEEVDVHALVSSIAETHVPSPFALRIKGRLPTLFSPRTPLEQVFGNLVANAVKHHDKDKGVIEIEASALPDGGTEFIVRDDGPGIAPQFHERVFQMFQTLKSRDRISGSGLGLAIVKKLVEWRGGRIWVESDGQGHGTAFHFTWF